jgi:hypothetical protein
MDESYNYNMGCNKLITKVAHAISFVQIKREVSSKTLLKKSYKGGKP